MNPSVGADAPALRATVADIAYDQLVVGGGDAVEVAPLVAGINSAGVVVDGRRMHIAQAWSRSFAGAVRGVDTVTIAHPSTWGRRRTEVLRVAASEHVAHVDLVPRAVAIARSHLDAAPVCVMVIEVHDRIDVHELRSSGSGWEIAVTQVLTDPDDLPGYLRTVVDNRIEAILVDGRDRDAVEAAVRDAEDSTIIGRVLVVDRGLLRGFGGTELPAPPIDDGPPPSARPGRGPIVAAAAAVLVVLSVVAAIAVVVLGDRTSSAPAAKADRFVELGRVDLTVPGDFRQSSGQPADGVVSRTTFAAPGDDRRLIVLQNTVRDDSTLASVAVSLRNRIDQRGDSVVQEFSASTRFADREVISYREVPVSGGPIRWYLTVERGLQVSIGCQSGSAGESVDQQCRIAVGSVQIAPR